MPSDVFALEQIPTASSASSTSVATGFTGIFSPLPGYTVSWAITSDCVWTVQIVSTRGGWAGIGFGTQMAGSDVILCYMNGGAMTCVDSMVVGQFETAPTSDDEIGHTNDVLPGTVTGQILGGVLTAQFSRRCSTGDSIDHVITRAMTPMIFAHGPTPRPAQHGLFGRALGTVNLFTNQAALSNEDVFHLSTTSAAAFSSIGFIFLALQGSCSALSFDVDMADQDASADVAGDCWLPQDTCRVLPGPIAADHNAAGVHDDQRHPDPNHCGAVCLDLRLAFVPVQHGVLPDLRYPTRQALPVQQGCHPG